MTVREFLEKTTISPEVIAKHCGVHISQYFRWKTGKAFPEGGPLLHLVELSGGKIRAKDMPGARRGRHLRRKRG